MEVIAVLAIASLAFLVWQLIQAKRLTKFKKIIVKELKPKVEVAILASLEQTRSSTFPNNACHQQATLYFWTQNYGRILQAALQHEIISQQWLKDNGYLRSSQHLLFLANRT